MSLFDNLMGGDDFWSSVTKNALPALFTSLTVKAPNTEGALEAMLPYYQQVASRAQGLNAQRDAAVAQYAGAIGGMPTPADAAGKAHADFGIQEANRKAETERTLQANGVRPDSGAYAGAISRNNAASGAGDVNAMNNAATGAAAAKTHALSQLPGMYTDPNASTSMAASSGMLHVADLQNQLYRQKAKDTMTAFKPENDVMAPKPGGSSVVKYFYGDGGQQGGGLPGRTTSIDANGINWDNVG